MTAPSWRGRAVVLAVAVVTAAPGLRNGFVYDDLPIVVQDTRLHDLSAWRAILTQRYWPERFGDDQLYRPLTSLSLAVDWHVGAGRPVASHLTNVLLHGLVALLVLTLAARMLSPPGALVAALWFAVQPVHVEAVANVVGRSELLAAVGYLAAALAFARAGRRETTPGARVAWGATVFMAALVAAGSKEHGLTLPAALLVIDAWEAHAAGERWRQRIRRTWPLWMAAVLAGALFVLARHAAIGVGFERGPAAAGLRGQDALSRFIIMLPGYATWARLLVVPWRLSADYSPNALVPSLRMTLSHVAGLAVIAGAAALAVWGRRRAPAVTAGLAWFAVTASVAANIIVPTGVLVAERTLYLPSVGGAIALGALWTLLPPRRWLWPVTALILTVLAARSIERAALWHDDPGFVDRLATDAPDSYRAHWVRGTWAFRRGDFAAGERLQLEALTIFPYDANLVAELGMHYVDAGAWNPADRFLTMALRMDSTLVEAAVKLMLARLRAGRPDSAAQLARQAVRWYPRDEGALLTAIHVLQQAGQAAEAAEVVPALLAVTPLRWEYVQTAAEALGRAGRCEEARALVARARRMAPPGEAAPTLLATTLGGDADCAGRFR